MTKGIILTRWWKSFWPRTFEEVVLWLSIFMLPWQLRHTFYFVAYGGNYYEYASVHLYATDLLIIILLGVWLLRRPKVQLPPKWIWQPLVLWLMWITITSWSGLDPQNSLQQAAHYWLMFGWLLYLVNNVKDLRRILWPLVWGVGLQAVWGIAQFAVNHDLGLHLLGESPLGPDQGGVAVVGDEAHRQIRAQGLLPHPNMLGGLLAFAVVPFLVLYRNVSQRRRGWLLLLAGFMGIALVLSFSRASWAVVLTVLLIVGAVVMLQRKWGRTLWLPMAVLLLGGMVAMAWQWPNVAGRFSVASPLEQRSVEDRAASWNDWKQVINGYEFAGVGTGNYTQALIRLRPDQLVWTYKPVHNIYLLMTAENGVVGTAIWLWLALSVFWLWLKTAKPARFEWWLGLAGLGILAGGLADHWAVSFQQGRLLVFLALALIILESRVLLGGREVK